LPALAGIPAYSAPALTVGRLSMTEAYRQILQANGVEPRADLVRSLADKSRELVLAAGRLYDDALPFLRALRAGGVKTAIVSNCDENTRPLLVSLGVAALVDTLVLSCEVGVAKPEAAIYRAALDRLGVAPGDALFIDDNAGFCAAAADLGISAVQIVRDGSDGLGGIRSLREAEAIVLRGH
jgi:putative hydrolase of the HAD superfamily